MDGKAGRTHHGERYKARIDHPARQLAKHQPQKFEAYLRIEFALSMRAFPELERYFRHAKALLRGHEDIEQNLETNGRELVGNVVQPVALEHEKTAHRIGDFDAQNPAGKSGGRATDFGALRREGIRAAAGHVPAS